VPRAIGIRLAVKNGTLKSFMYIFSLDNIIFLFSWF